MRLFIVSGLILMLFVGCTKPRYADVDCTEGCYLLSGTVTDLPTNQALEGVKVIMGEGVKTLFETLTDKNGEYQITIPKSHFSNTSGVDIHFEKANHIKKDDYVENFFDTNHVDVPQVKDIALFKSATLRVAVKINGANAYSFVEVGYKYDYTEYGHILNGGTAYDTVLVYETAGDVETKFNWNTLGGSDEKNYSTTLTVPTGGTKTVYINL